MELIILQWDLKSETCQEISDEELHCGVDLSLYAVSLLTRDIAFLFSTLCLELLWIYSNTTLNPGNRLSLPGLTRHIRLMIGISHLSIFGIVVDGSCYIFHCFYFFVILHFSVIFYDCLLVDIYFLFSCLLTVVWATNNPY